MIRTFLVDDEPLFREGFQKTVQWSELGFKIAGEAIDGKEAVEMLKHVQVDLVFTDIRMPVMDGLELISEIRKTNTSIYIVVLSAYDDFALVRQAFRLGANDYLLKDDFDSSDILHIAGELQTFRKTDRVISPSVRDRFFEERMLEECITGTLDASLYVSFTAPELQLPCKGLSVAALRIDIESNSKITASFVRTICSETAADCGIDCCRIPQQSGLYALVIREQAAVSRQTQIDRFEQFKQKLQEQLCKAAMESAAALPVITIGISGGNDMYNLEYYWKESCRALNSAAIWGYGGIVTPEQAASRNSSNGKNIDKEQRIQTLSAYIENWNFQGLAKAVKELMVSPGTCTPDQVPEIRELFHAYYILLSMLLKSCPAVGSADFRQNLNRYLLFEQQGADLPTLNRWLKNTLVSLAAAIGGSSRLVKKVVARIHEKYAVSLSVRSLAAYFSVNPSYLSRICTAELGMPLTEYINRVRIKQACILMKQERKKIYEIAEAVGFPNQETFTRTFKRIQGVLPKDFFADQEPDR